MPEEKYESPQDRDNAVRDAEAISRRDESLEAVVRARSMRDPRGPDGFKDAVSSATKDASKSAKEAKEAAEKGAVRDMSGTMPTMADTVGNFAPNPEVANAGGIGVVASNTKTGSEQQAEDPESVETPAEAATEKLKADAKAAEKRAADAKSR